MKESDIQKKIILWINKNFDGVVVWKLSDAFNRGRPDLVAFFAHHAPPPVEFIDKAMKAIDQGIFIDHFGSTLLVPVFIEVKQPGGKTTALQQKTLDDLAAMGGRCLVATSVEDVAAFMANTKIGMRKVPAQ